MATAKKSAPSASKKEVQPVKPSVVGKPPAVTGTVAPARKAARAPRKAPIDPAQRANYIEVAAFYIAERRGFAPGNPEQDYLEAAAEIDRLIAAGHFGG